MYKGLEDDAYQYTIAQNTPNDGSYDWEIPFALGAGTDYWIEIEDTASDVHDFSEFFEIEAAVASITITSPTSSSSWSVGGTYTITWTSGESLTDLTIALFKGESSVDSIAASASGSAGSYSWTIPLDISPGTGYYIAIMDNTDTSIFGISDEFAITASGGETEGSIFFIAPTEVSTWKTGAEYVISWNSDLELGTLTISLYKGGEFHSEITSGVSGSDTNYHWTIPTSLAEGNDYQIKIVDSTNTAIWGITKEFRIIKGEDSGSGFTPGFELAIAIAGIAVIVLQRKKQKS